jgi:hypothetical protein
VLAWLGACGWLVLKAVVWSSLTAARLAACCWRTSRHSSTPHSSSRVLVSAASSADAVAGLALVAVAIKAATGSAAAWSRRVSSALASVVIWRRRWSARSAWVSSTRRASSWAVARVAFSCAAAQVRGVAPVRAVQDATPDVAAAARVVAAATWSATVASGRAVMLFSSAVTAWLVAVVATAAARSAPARCWALVIRPMWLCSVTSITAPHTGQRQALRTSTGSSWASTAKAMAAPIISTRSVVPVARSVADAAAIATTSSVQAVAAVTAMWRAFTGRPQCLGRRRTASRCRQTGWGPT